jgi:outer membrane protein, multidrug efflux system
MRMFSEGRRNVKSLVAVLPLLAVSGCLLGPDYKRPEVAVAPTFRAQPIQSDASSLADAPWWKIFDDKALQGLISEALANNLDVQVAVARIEQARAQVGVAQSESYPQVGYQAFGGADHSAASGSSGAVTSATFGGLLSAAWEIDVWGRIRRSTEAARANLLAQQDVRRGVMLTLVSEVAAGYFRLLELDQELAIARESAQAYKKNVDLFTLRFKAGRDNQLPVDRAEAAYNSSNSKISDLTRAIEQQENVLSVLVGSYPRSIARGRPLIEQSAPQTPVGVTTDLLKRRPDILEAEQRMVQANAEIGVAVANFYPTIGISALAGGQGVSIEHAAFSGFGIWNLAGSVAGPIFTGGRLEEQYHERQAFWDETIAQYKTVILTAFRETSDGLIAQRTLVDQRAALQSQVQALKQAVGVSLLRYDAGRANYFEVLQAEQELFPAEDALAFAESDQLVTVVNLYKALGGGWNLTDAQWAKPL